MPRKFMSGEKKHFLILPGFCFFIHYIYVIEVPYQLKRDCMLIKSHLTYLNTDRSNVIIKLKLLVRARNIHIADLKSRLVVNCFSRGQVLKGHMQKCIDCLK